MVLNKRSWGIRLVLQFKISSKWDQSKWKKKRCSKSQKYLHTENSFVHLQWYCFVLTHRRFPPHTCSLLTKVICVDVTSSTISKSGPYAAWAVVQGSCMAALQFSWHRHPATCNCAHCYKLTCEGKPCGTGCRSTPSPFSFSHPNIWHRDTP